MPYQIPIDEAQKAFPSYQFIAALTPSEQKAAFHVRDTQGTDLCLKLIKPGDEARVHREIQAMQAFSHPNIVKLVEYTYTSRSGALLHYLIEEFVDGSDLSSHLGTPWSAGSASEFFAQLSDGLDELRAKSVVHRDLKPSNIRVRPDGQPVIIDFGLARHLELPDITQTADGARIGTPIYFAPEQFDRTKYEIDHRTDLFALGILLYEALVGRHPFHTPGITMRELRERTCEGTSQWDCAEVQALPPKWTLLVKRLMEKTRARRPASAGTVAKLLRKLGEVTA